MDSGNWPIVPVKEVATGIYDGPHATPKKTPAGPVFLGISSLNKGRLDLSESEHLSEEDFVKWTRRVEPAVNDIVFSYETRIGEVAIIPEGLRCCLGRRMGLIRPDKKKIVPRFLLYQYLSPNFQELLKSRTISGSTVERILLTEFPDFPIVLPLIEEQNAIAGILGALDDKIELNRQMNGTLEEMAQAVFKSWFVDFDPVVAKVAGRQPFGMDAETTALFSDHFSSSTLGFIPTGWSVATIADICSPQYGFTTSATEEPIGPRFLRVTDINKLPWIEWNSVPYCRINDLDYSKYCLRIGDVVISRMADPGKAAIVEIEIPAVFASYLIRLKTSPTRSYFLFYFLRSEQYLDYADAATSGTVQQSMNAKVITAAPMVLPPENLSQRFGELVKPYRNKIQLNLHESEILSSIRDTLLPKLLSGEIRTHDAEKMVEKAL